MQLWIQTKKNFPLLWTMVKREMQIRYAGSALGVVWAYVQPLLTVAVYFLVFDIVFGMRMGEQAPTQRVGTYLVVGALPWLAFCESVSRGASSLVDAGSVLQKNALPPFLFVLRSVIASALAFVPIMLLLPVIYVFLTGYWQALWVFPLLVALQWALSYLFAYVLAILTAASRDTTQVLSFGLSIGIYLSPILFPMDFFPSQWSWVLFINPMTSLVLSYQAVLLKGEVPDAVLWMTLMGWIALLTFLLKSMISKSRDELVDWL